MRSLRIPLLAVACLVATLVHPSALVGQAPAPARGVAFATIDQADLETWLTYLSSDALQGRQVFTEGYGLATAYIAEQLERMGARPMGDEGYFQTVKRVGYRVTRNSSITVTANGRTRTFAHGDHVTFPANGGGRQTLSFDGVEFTGYGMVNLGASYDDFAGREVRDQLVLWMPGTPSALDQGAGGRRGNRSNYIVQTLGAAGTLSYTPAPAPPSPEELAAEAALDEANAAVEAAQTRLQAARAAARGGRGGGRGRGGFGRGGRGAAEPPDLTTVQSVELPVAPQITGDDEFFAFLFGGSGQSFDDIRTKAAAGEPLEPTHLDVSVTIDVNNTYEVVSTELTKNVVAMIEGSDPVLRNTYVLFGAHLDHTGYRTAPGGRGGRGGGGAAPESGPPDLINNGADDDGSGSTGLLGVAKAFATGPTPKRSVVFVWHAGEEAGLLGSRYMADFPVVPLEAVQAQLNMDMIGRNRDDDESLGNTVFVIGADRISTDLHNLVEATNDTLAEPLKLDYEYNDPSDPNSFYTRSDHYSYAAKGIPIAFFFTGTHPDYHRASDEVDKILFPKLRRIAQLVYEAGFNVANSEQTLERDNLGPRAGRGFSGRIGR